MFRFLIGAALVAYAAAECPNSCSGHGTCGLYDTCTCYRNFQGNDCSERVCPFGKAFVDSPLGDINGDGTVQGTNDGQANGESTDTSVVWTKFTNTNNNHVDDDSGNSAGYGPDYATLVATGATYGVPVYERWPYKASDEGTDLSAADEAAAITKDQSGISSPASVSAVGITAAQNNEGHFYRECSNKGICDRKSGECDCFDGYTGSACQRTTCPNDCSGHGTCEYQRELADGKRIASPDAPAQQLGNRMMACRTWTTTSATGVVSIVRSDGSCNWIEGNADDNHGSQYSLWDEESQMGCRCDAGYSGPDCSSKKCPLGDDPLTRGGKMTGHTDGAPNQIGIIASGSQLQTTAGFNGVFIDGVNSVTAATASAMATMDAADFMVGLGRGLKAGDWVNIDVDSGSSFVGCRIKSLDDTNDPYASIDDTACTSATTKTQIVQTANPTDCSFNGNDDGKIDQIVCHGSVDYPQLAAPATTTTKTTVVDATQVDEIQTLTVKVGTSAKIYYTSLDTGKEYEVGVVTAPAAHADCAAQATSNGVIENMFEAIPNDVVPGIIVSEAVAGTFISTANGGCAYDITFTHNPGALHMIRGETHVLSSASAGVLEGTQYTRNTISAVTDGTTALLFNAQHITTNGRGDTRDVTTDHFYSMQVAGTAPWDGLPQGARFRVEGTQWNDGWYTVGHFAPSATLVYVVEPVVDEDASGSKTFIHTPTISVTASKKMVGTKEAIVCSGRGLCDGSTGACECFRGSTGLACDQQTALEA